VAFTFVMSVCLSVRIEQLAYQWTDFMKFDTTVLYMQTNIHL